MDLEEIVINWVDSAQDRDTWRALGNAALNLRIPYVMELVNYYHNYHYLVFGYYWLVAEFSSPV